MSMLDLAQQPGEVRSAQTDEGALTIRPQASANTGEVTRGTQCLATQDISHAGLLVIGPTDGVVPPSSV